MRFLYLEYLLNCCLPRSRTSNRKTKQNESFVQIWKKFHDKVYAGKISWKPKWWWAATGAGISSVRLWNILSVDDANVAHLQHNCRPVVTQMVDTNESVNEKAANHLFNE